MFRKIASNFAVEIDYTILDDLEIKTHEYGQPQSNDKSYPYWMTYGKPKINLSDNHGTISFTRNTRLLNSDFSKRTISKLKETFGDSVDWDIDRVHIIKTDGFILPHRDEVRVTSINIGMRNSSFATTTFGRNNLMNDFVTNETTSFVCNDGDVYLLDVTKCHAVYPTKAGPRYLITYGFDRKYDVISNILNIDQTHLR